MAVPVSQLENQVPMVHWLAMAFLPIALLSYFEKDVHCQEPIVLRDLSVLSNVEIIDFDKSGIRLDNGQSLTWDKVLRAKVDTEEQVEFDRNLNEIGMPIFRLKSRIRNKDWASIGDVAEPLYQLLGVNEPNSIEADALNYLICYGTMKARLFRGDRPGAVTPFLQAALIQKNASKQNRDGVPELLSSKEANSFMSDAILPIWFDESQLRPAFDALSTTFLPTSPKTETGAIIYLASFAISLERFKLATELIELIESREGKDDEWARILRASLHVKQNEFGAAERILSEKPFELATTSAIQTYFKAARHFVSILDERQTPRVKESDAVDSILTLLSIPAEFSIQFPDLSAAAIFQASRLAEVIHFQEEKVILRQQLLTRFPNSYHARVMEKERVMGQN